MTGPKRKTPLGRNGLKDSDVESGDVYAEKSGPAKWSFGVLNDKDTLEVPGSVLLLASDRNEPLGLRNAPARMSHSSLPTGIPAVEPLPSPPPHPGDSKKMTKDGKVILEPQPDDSANDPLNWPGWKRDSALLTLGLYCMVGGGMTPILAAGFNNIAKDYHVPVSSVSLTTGLYMLGLGIGCVIFSPTAILFGKRPVYLFSSIMFILSTVWCALSPNFASLIVARIFQGISVSPVECLPSATIAEIFFLHERAFRIGIYTLLLLSGKNLMPLVGAGIIQQLGWRWVFWIIAFVVVACGVLLFLFVPETFWDRTPTHKKRKSRPSLFRRLSRLESAKFLHLGHAQGPPKEPQDGGANPEASEIKATMSNQHASATAAPDLSLRPFSTSPVTPTHQRHKNIHVGFAPEMEPATPTDGRLPVRKSVSPAVLPADHHNRSAAHARTAPYVDTQEDGWRDGSNEWHRQGESGHPTPLNADESAVATTDFATPAAATHLPSAYQHKQSDQDDFVRERGHGETVRDASSPSPSTIRIGGQAYTHALRDRPPMSFSQQLKPYNGRLNHDKWIRVAVRPFILYSYPAILWSAAVYSLSIGWLIVISESIAIIYRDAKTYNFTALQAGLIYVSPFIGGILGTAVAGKLSDLIVKAMARRNGGLYEPEFRLVMALPVALFTTVGLIGFGWSAQIDDNWIVPTVFFGLASFGCSLGSTTSITFCVDSYRQYAGEALVTLNFSKNVLHGFIFSLFITEWLTADGAKSVYIWLGVIHMIVLLSSIPMFIYGKRARMWTVRKNFVERRAKRFKEVKF